MRQVVISPLALEQLSEYRSTNYKLVFKILELMRDIQKNPFTGLGKPEALKHQFSGSWSRRITDEHRLIYKVTDDTIIIASCRGHYLPD